MPPDNPRQDAATSSDTLRQPATSNDSEYTFSIDEALTLYEAAGLPRTSRSLQRYCAKGHLDAHRIETPFGEKFFITPASVHRHIGYIKEMEMQPVATGRDTSRQVAPPVAAENNDKINELTVATSDDTVRQPATEQAVSRPVAADQRFIEFLERENDFLREQVKIK